jgi:hypothetical protein
VALGAVFLAARIVLFLAAAVCGISAMAGYVESSNFPAWKQTDAKVEFAFTQNASSPTVAGANDWGADFSRVRYTYTVGGSTYVGNRVMPLEWVYLPRSAVSTISRPISAVFYDPATPSESYILAVRPTTQIIILTLVSTICLVLAVGLPGLIRYCSNAVMHFNRTEGSERHGT